MTSLDSGLIPELEGMPRTYSDDFTTEVLRQHSEQKRNLGTILNARAAEAAGAAVTWYGRKTAIATLGDRRVLLDGYVCNQGWVGSKIATDKWLTKEFLLKAGVATPAARKCLSVDEALDFNRRSGRAIVLKPLGGMGGKGVSVNLLEDADVISAFERASEIGRGGVLAEEYIDGDREYRVLATQHECVSVVQRLLPNVTGDGTSTIRELIEEKNSARRLNPALVDRYIPHDVVTERYLNAKDLSLESVLALGQTEVVRDVGGLSSGGEPVERFEEVEERVKRIAVAASAAIPGLTWSGSDVLVERGTGKPWIIEINSTPDIMGSTFPLYGVPKDVASLKWSMRLESAPPIASGPVSFPQGKPADEDLAFLDDGVWDDRGKTRLSSILRALLIERGYRVEDRSESVVSVVDDDGAELWFTNQFLGVRDSIAVRQVVGRSSTVRRLLEGASVPLVPGALVYSPEAAREFVETHDGPFCSVPQLREWGSLQSRVFKTAEGLGRVLRETRGPWLVQVSPMLGTRFTVSATPSRILWIRGPRGPNFSSAVRKAVGECAVQACKAIPELRWAAVDISFHESTGALVEGISLNPRVYREEIVLAGSVDHVYDKLIRSARK